MADQIIPGPCPPTGCPPPTEIDCIQVTKVYDFCFESDTLSNICTAIPTTCIGATTASCTVTSCTCTFASSSPTGQDGFVNATFVIACTIQFTVSSALATCTTSTTASLLKTVTLCAPTGTVQSCQVVGESCGPVAIVDNTVCTTLTVCTVFLSTALVTLLVPTYGFCTPAPCATLPVLPCPPSSLFPPQCLPTG
jgi:hypothetical protein